MCVKSLDNAAAKQSLAVDRSSVLGLHVVKIQVLAVLYVQIIDGTWCILT